MTLSKAACFVLGCGLLGAIASTQERSSPSGHDELQRWRLTLQPSAERYADVGQVYVLLTVENVGDESREIALPYLESHPWYQWIAVHRDGDRLSPREDGDFAYRPSVLRGGEKLSQLVALNEFIQPETDKGEGRYSISWDGGTIGFANTASAEFVVDAAQGPNEDARSLGYYLDNEHVEALDVTELLWQFDADDPRCLVLLRQSRGDVVDTELLFHLLEESSDLGIRREAVRAFGKIGLRPDLVQRLLLSLQTQHDGPLLELGAVTVQRLRGDSSSLEQSLGNGR